MNGFIVMFITLNLVNVILQTFRAIATIKCNKLVASLVNALAFGFYTIVVVYMVADFNLWVKVLIVGGCNFIGVYTVKYLEEKHSKNKLWLVKFTIQEKLEKSAVSLLNETNIPYTLYNSQGYTIIDCYCNSREETHTIKEINKVCNGKMFAAENKF